MTYRFMKAGCPSSDIFQSHSSQCAKLESNSYDIDSDHLQDVQNKSK